jgi:hypothetical protein
MLSAVSRQVHGPDHKTTIEADELLKKCKERLPLLFVAYALVLVACIEINHRRLPQSLHLFQSMLHYFELRKLVWEVTNAPPPSSWQFVNLYIV